MVAVADQSEPDERRGRACKHCPCLRCPIKAQVTARAAWTGLYLDCAKKRELDDPTQLLGNGASARSTLPCLLLLGRDPVS